MPDATVYVVDDDPGLNTSLAALFQSVGIKTEVFQDPEAFMAQPTINRPGCVVLDARMPGICGLDVLEQIRNRRWSIPILMISGHADVAMAVRALQAQRTSVPCRATEACHLDGTGTRRVEMRHGRHVQQSHGAGNGFERQGRGRAPCQSVAQDGMSFRRGTGAGGGYLPTEGLLSADRSVEGRVRLYACLTPPFVQTGEIHLDKKTQDH
ncbi:MAG: response regulator receiver [Rhodospirillaceae bacterium]|nr:MAG: response regulator receiver [Rhodospirillaceae bacterium]